MRGNDMEPEARVKLDDIWAWLLAPISPNRAKEQQRHFRKLGLFLRVVLTVCVPLIIGQVIGGAWTAAFATSGLLGVIGLGIIALQRGWSVTVIASLILGSGLVTAAMLAIAAGRDGVTSVAWMALAPVVALASAGRRAGWVMFAVTVVCVSVSMVGMEQRWFGEFLQNERALWARLSSLLGACIAVFLVTLAYEHENDANLRNLQAKHDALAEARLAAEKASRAKSDFIAMISHEIRTPLNGVTGMARLLQAERDPGRIAEGLTIIDSSADMLLAVINDVLDFSKIESNRLELERVPMSPAQELRTVVDLLRLQAEAKGNHVEVCIASETPAWMEGDPTRFRQIVLNFLSNAAKFTKQGRIGVSLGTQRGMLTLQVADTGVGMSEEAMGRIFQPFAQADSSTTREFGGTGLGLAIVRSLVLAMGGSVDVSSTIGEGSRFTVSLPIVAVAAPKNVSALGERTASPKRVLVVDDNDAAQLVARRTLEKLGHQVTVAHNGAEALAAVGKGEFDAIFMDCHMPVMDGFETTRTLRQRGCNLPIIALTAAASTEDRVTCLDAGMDHVLSKPLRIEQLANALATQLRPSVLGA